MEQGGRYAHAIQLKEVPNSLMPKDALKKCKKGDLTHTQACAHKITISNLNSSEYTCLNSLNVFYSVGACICHFRNRLIKPSCLQVSLHPFHSHRDGVSFRQVLGNHTSSFCTCTRMHQAYRDQEVQWVL